ncbi:uncharacterized protein E0L32_010862 [Thyridium curvatum]|uniref:Alpha-L-rhamnosidase six-hairpin glycosidase domain-containing protein n=1 Tax=Thyridium curvatum TaxID=1093900 RepID=A0A507AQV7_9PEZI|nr:uncharacterized protein E0L32_010862 [Thyridium curvatum]TPX07268.1 hypothetical protein E0L32_010862 [Thyridium curvatum]
MPSVFIPLSNTTTAAFILLPTLAVVLGFLWRRRGPEAIIYHDATKDTITLTDRRGHLSLRLRYGQSCVIEQAVVRGRQVLAATGAASGIKVGDRWYTSRAAIHTPRLLITSSTLAVSEIAFGPPNALVTETWLFKVEKDRITWRIDRTYPQDMVLDDVAFPSWNFTSMTTWTGGILGTGGVVLPKYLENPNMTYGVHSGAVTFWNRLANDALRIVSTPVSSRGQARHCTSRFSHQPQLGNAVSEFTYNATVSHDELQPKYNLNRFLGDRQDLWAPFTARAGEQSVEISLQALDYKKAYNRGTFKGLDGGSIRELLNTVARYGVIDAKLVGANGWRTGYICLHEPFFAQIASALNDSNYDANLAKCLDYERDHAIESDGRVLARWKNDSVDAMAGTYNRYGFYEAQWGFLLDSQPDYVTNVVQQFYISGDVKWLAGQKEACERALEYLIRREVDDSGIVTVLTDSRLQGKGSDWYDIVWASYKNAWVNAHLYNALTLWADAEEALGDNAKAASYRAFAARLKESFNLPIQQGGFWDEKNRMYVYWHDKDGSVHGDNTFTGVNFAAISVGICDDAGRRKAIIERIEADMEKEGLFYWPSNFTTFADDEVASSNLPFPKYENGDIFLSWGALAIRAHALHKPELALKYVRNVLKRYDEDGLSFQRYEREKQNGAGDDILAGNCTAIVGLYRDIYGIQPRPNRLLLDPHLSPELNGTQLLYTLRGQEYQIDLSTGGSSITTENVTVEAPCPFGISVSDAAVQYFPGDGKEWGLSVRPANSQELNIQVEAWESNLASVSPRRWTETAMATGKVAHEVAGLQPNSLYTLYSSRDTKTSLWADDSGRIQFSSLLNAKSPVSCELVLAKY